MAFVPETATYEAGVYQLETTDPVEGGSGGISNQQAKHLANRTKWLKENTVPLAGAVFMTGNLAVLTAAAPRRALDVQGKMFLRDTSAGSDSLVISTNLSTSANGDSGGIMFAASDGSNVMGPRIRGRANADNSTFARRDLVFVQHNTDDYTSTFDVMRVTPGGILNIGSSDDVSSVFSSQTKLVVGSNSSTNDPRILLRGFLETDSAGLDLSGGDQRHGVVQGFGGALIFYSNSVANSTTVAEAMRITNSQRVGIGLTTPDSRLHVNGNIAVNSGYSFGVIPETDRFTSGSYSVANYGLTITNGVFSGLAAYLSGYYGVALCAAGAIQWIVDTSGNLTPGSNNLNDIGNASNRVKDIYCGGLINFDLNDAFGYDRTNNAFLWKVNSVVKAQMQSSGQLEILLGTGQGTPAAVGAEGLRITNNAAATDSAFLSIVSGTTGISTVAFGDRDSVNVGTIKYDNATNTLELWANGDGTGASGNKLIIGGGKVASSTSPPAGDNSKELATTEWVQALAAMLTPTGAVMGFAMSTVPTGWLECNGAAVSRTTYATLFAKIGTTFGAGNGSSTFNVPDMRGEFLRGWDHGRGIDVGRAFGSGQTDAVDPDQLQLTFEAFSESSGGTSNMEGFVVGSSDTSLGSHTNTTAIVNSSGNTATETRPRNLALMYCIKT